MPNGSNALIDVGYNKEGKIVMIVHGNMADEEKKQFDAVSLLSEAQALKLLGDLKMAIIMMKTEREKL